MNEFTTVLETQFQVIPSPMELVRELQHDQAHLLHQELAA
jgi:hypothetical protein